MRTIRLWQALVGLGLFILIALLMKGSNSVSIAAQAAPAANTLSRASEPVIVKGVFPNAPVDQVFVYRNVGGAWQQIPFQVDEVTSTGVYTSTEDGKLDSNDEIVFMSSDLGSEAAISITATLPVSTTWYKIEVTDPITPTNQGWAYIVRSSVLNVTNLTDYANYDPATRRISTASYALGWASGHAGLDYTSLFGGPDILDRTKLRVLYTALANTGLITEESQLLLPPPPLVEIKDGPVRAIIGRGSATTFAYASFYQTLTVVDTSTLPAIFHIDGVRISTDLNAAAAGGTFYSENVAAGVPIDGAADVVPLTPFLTPWRQVSLPSGTMIQILGLSPTGGTRRYYYKDDSTFDPNDSGDGKSYADSGFSVQNPTTQVIIYLSSQYILPGKQPNHGAEYYAFTRFPLRIRAQLQSERLLPAIYLPLIRR